MHNVTEPLLDPVSGKPSFVRAMAAQLADNRPFKCFRQWEWEWLRQDLSVAQIEEGLTAAFEYGPNPSRSLVFDVLEAARARVEARLPSVWQSLGDAFRRREAEVHRSFGRAGEKLPGLNQTAASKRYAPLRAWRSPGSIKVAQTVLLPEQHPLMANTKLASLLPFGRQCFRGSVACTPTQHTGLRSAPTGQEGCKALRQHKAVSVLARMPGEKRQGVSE